MRKAVRHWALARLALKRIVTDRLGGAQTFFEIARFHKARALAPDAGITVRLQLHSYLKSIAFALPELALRTIHLGQRPLKILDMMPDFMGDHIGLCEITRCAEALLELVEEVRIEVNLLVERAVEWTHGGLGGAAARASATGIEGQDRGRITLAMLSENVAPHFLGRPEHLQ